MRNFFSVLPTALNTLIMRTTMTLARLRECSAWSDPSQEVFAISTDNSHVSWDGLFNQSSKIIWSRINAFGIRELADDRLVRIASLRNEGSGEPKCTYSPEHSLRTNFNAKYGCKWRLIRIYRPLALLDTSALAFNRASAHMRYSKPCVQRPLKNWQIKDLNNIGSLMKVESIAECCLWSILQYFDLH